MINPEFWLDEELSSISAHARLLYIGIWSICDDNYATFPDRPEWIKAQIFPYEEVNLLLLLSELSTKGKIIQFDEDGKRFWYVKNFFKYQVINRPSKAKYPEYKPRNNIPTPTLTEHSLSTQPEVKLNEVKLNEENGTPSQTAISFFSKGKTYEEYLSLFSQQSSPEFVCAEFDKFILYWTEPNGSGRKLRWQQQPTFEIKRRLVTWLSRNSQFNKSPSISNKSVTLTQ